MKNLYIAVFAAEGVAAGVLLYLGLREIVRHYFDVAALIPQFPYVGIVANLVGLCVVLPVIVFVTVSAVRGLGLDKA